ncbi:transcriptional regulator swi6, partial [Spiromyces aspiralis]
GYSYNTPTRQYQQQQQQQQQHPELLISSQDALGTNGQVTIVTILEFLARRASGHVIPAPVEIIEFIKKDPLFDPSGAVDASGNTLLHMSVQTMAMDIIEALLDRGADPCDANRDGRTPLMLALRTNVHYYRREQDQFPWLLRALGSSLVKRDKEGRTAIHWIAMPPQVSSASLQQQAQNAASHEQARIYYAQCVLAHLRAEGQIQIVKWEDYDGRTASATARASGLHQLGAFLDGATAEGEDTSVATPANGADVPSSRSQSQSRPQQQQTLPRPISNGIASRIKSVTNYQQSPLSNPVYVSTSLDLTSSSPRSASTPRTRYSEMGCDESPGRLSQQAQRKEKTKGGKHANCYEEVCERAVEMFRRFTRETREHHRRNWSMLEEDAQYAAKLLEDLKEERDATLEDVRALSELASGYDEVHRLEKELVSKLSGVIALRQVARSVKAFKLEGAEQSHNEDVGEMELALEKLRSRESAYAESNFEMSQRYAEYLAVVKHWEARDGGEDWGQQQVNSSDDDEEDERASEISEMQEQQIQERRRRRRRRRRQTHSEQGVERCTSDSAEMLEDERAEIDALTSSLRRDEERLRKLERVMAAACGNVPVDMVHETVQPVLEVMEQQQD